MTTDSARSIKAAFQGRYDILEALGEGGFGKVYRAQQVATRQTVAMKVLRLDESDSPEARERRIARFQREMQICSQIYHPNIVRLMDSGHTPEGIVFSVFEFVPGKNLAQVLAEEGALDPVEARHLFMQVLDALACAHAAGIVHRDLKPANLMVTPTGARRNVLVLDFGIGALSEEGAAAAFDGARITMTNEFVGTPSYTAPEQLLGRPPTWRSDLYSWGLSFLEALSGKRVVDGSTMPEIVFKQLSPDPVPIPESLADHPLGSILRRATVKDAAARDVTAESLLRELEAYDVSSLKDWTRPIRVQAAPSTTVNVRTGVQTAPRPRLVEGERRQVTAVCCVLDASETGTKGDLEELDQVLGGQQESLMEIVGIHDGHVAGVLGDAMMFYFGHPIAREDDAHRAARAALAIAADVARRPALGRSRSIHVDVRIGVHTGLVVTREVRAGFAGHGYLGTTPSLARRLAMLADSGTILTSSATQRLLRKEFVFDDTDVSDPDGARAPTRIYGLRGRRRAPGTRGVPVIGRERELATLMDHWERSQAGAGQAILITGEAGIGKSRLARELDWRLAEQRHGWLECRCAPDRANIALHPIVDLVERTLDPNQEATPEEKMEKLEALLAHYEFDLHESVPIFASLIALPLEKSKKSWPPLDVSPLRLGEMTRNTVLSLLFAMAEKEPLVLFVEDLHWADPSTLDLLGHLVHEVGSSRALALFTARPEFVPPFSRSEMAQLQLGRLGRGDVEQLTARITLGRSLPPEVLDAIANRTDGVPLFVEELVLAMIEMGALVEREGRYELAMPLSEVAIPTSLLDSLAARLDRLGRAKETAQIGATIGREFGFELVSAVSPMEPHELQEDLDRLVAAELVYRKRRPKSATYFFKHALIRDAAYASMLKGSQEQVHARIAESLEQHFPDVVSEHPDVLARHHAAAGHGPQAIAYALRAGNAALARSAYADALAHARGALASLEGVPDERTRTENELALNGIIVPALMASQGYATEETRALLARSRKLIDQLGESEHVFLLLWATAMYQYGTGELGAASETAKTFLDLAVKTANRSRQVAALALLGQCRLSTGRLAEAEPLLSRAVELYDTDADRGHVFAYGMDSRVYALCYLGVALSIQGQFARAATCAELARSWARELKSRHVTCATLFGLACVAYARGDRDAIVPLSDELRQVVASYGFSFYAPMTELFRAWAERDLASAEAILAQMTAFGGVASSGLWVAMVAELLGENGRDDEAVARLDDRIARHDDGSTYMVPELLRLKGEILAKTPATREAGMTTLRSAMARARESGALLFELRAARGFAAQAVSEAERAEASACLRGALEKFSVVEEHAELSAARSALEKVMSHNDGEEGHR
ncbi:MAG TPA: TOMM system kinase/cyclase fusion protein [Polyangiaceae bacterium]